MGRRADRISVRTDSFSGIGSYLFVLVYSLPKTDIWIWNALAALAGFFFLLPSAGASPPSIDPGRVLYQLSGGDASITLREFSRLAGIQLVFPLSAVRGVKTQSLVGPYTAAEALRQLLACTPLEAVHDDATGAWAVRRRAPPPAVPAKPRPHHPPSELEPPEETVEMDSFDVSSRRNAGLQTQTILRTDAEAPIYHQVITRKQIEASGVTSVAELMTLVSGYSGEGMEYLQSSVNLSRDGTGTVFYSGAFLKLRGFDSTRTAVLLNGRRLPINIDSRGPNLSRIPLAAVERVNVLPFSGSALDGDDVIGGAVDIVLRKDYVGRSLTFLYGTTTQGGGDESAITAVEGMTLGDGRTKATFILDYQHRSALRLSDRQFLLRAEATDPLEDIWRQLQQSSLSLFFLNTENMTYAMTASPSYPATVVVNAPLGLGVPGGTGQLFAVVPGAQDGTKLTPADFAPSPTVGAIARRNQRAILRRPTETYSFTAQIEHVFVPEKWELYLEISYSRAVDRFSTAESVNALLLNRTDPLNPFRTNVVPGFVGRPITVFFDPVDLPDNVFDQKNSGARFVAGMKGMINERWNWTVDSSFDHTDTHTTIDSPNTSLNALIRYIYPVPDYPWSSIYNPLADHRAFPVSQDTIDRFFRYRSVAIAQADVYEINARIFGKPIDLPAGPLGVSVRAEFRREVNHVRNEIDSSPELNQLLGGALPSSSTSALDQIDSLSLAGEICIPIIGPRWRPLPLDTMELNSSTRAFRAYEGGVKLAQTLAIKISPAPWIALRGCYSEGYMPPPLSARNAPSAELHTVSWSDPLSNGPGLQEFTLVRRGNPSLRAETSSSKVAGILLKPHFASGIVITADFWSIDGKNGIRELLAQEILDHPALFGDRVTRTPTSFGTAITIDDRPINLASQSSSGLDLTLNGHADYSRFGVFDFSSTATFVHSYREQIFASEPPIDLLSRVGGQNHGFSAPSPQLPLRGRATLSWEKGSFRIGVTANYTSPYIAQIPSPLPGRGSTLSSNKDFETVSSSTLWDLQLNYVTWRTGWRRGRTTWSLGVRNLFDRAPSYRADGLAFYSHFEDPRMRFIYLRVQQEW